MKRWCVLSNDRAGLGRVYTKNVGVLTIKRKKKYNKVLNCYNVLLLKNYGVFVNKRNELRTISAR